MYRSCQSLSDGMERLQADSQQNLREISTTWAELATLLQAKHQLEEVIEQQAAEIQQNLHSLSSMEQRLSALTHAGTKWRLLSDKKRRRRRP